MPYTLAKWALWLIAGAAIGVAVGWLLRGLRPPSPVDAPVDEPAEVAELRARVAELSQVEIERARLRIELDDCRSGGNALFDAVATRPGVTAAAPPAVPDEPAAGIVAERDRLAAEVREQAATIGDLRARLWNSEARIGELQGLLAGRSAVTAPPVPDLEAAAAVLGEKVRLNDLTVVEGIGPKIADLLHSKGNIATWWELHQADVAALRALLAEAGPRFEIHDPASWPVQAGLLAGGQWDEFKALADRLRAGRLGG